MNKVIGFSRLSLCAALLAAAYAPAQTNGTWTNAAGGLYSSASNWQGGAVAGGAGATANFSQVDLNGDASVSVEAPLTIGHLIFGDSNTATGGVWDFFTSNASVITLDAAAPTITVNQLTPATEFDDVFLGTGLAGTAGFTKLGSGILTIGAPSATLTGPININEGTLRVGPLGTLAGTAGVINKTMANGTTIETQAAGAALVGVSVAPNATATMRILGSGSNFLNTIQGSGSGTLNLEFGTAGATVSGEGNWATGGGFAVVNMTGLGETLTFFRGRINRPAPNSWSGNSFANSELNLDNVEFYIQTNSQGNNVPFGELNGTSTAVLRGGNGGGGSAPRYIIGANGTDGVFAGTVNGAGGPSGSGGVSIEKVGAGKHTFSGTFINSMVGTNTDIGRQGGVIRVSQGTLAFAGTADNVPGGFSTNKSTIDVLAGATLDVSGTTNVFSSSPLQQFQGSGTIVGPFNHVAGEIRPADVSTVDNDTSLTNVPVPTVGTITFNGNLSFNGGSIVYDMNSTPGVNDLIQVNGTTNVGGGGIVDPNFLGANPAVGQTYTFLNSTGGFSGSLANWTVNWPGRGAKPTVVATGNSLQFTTTPIGAGGSVIWTGATNNQWDVQTTQNWSLNGSPNTFFTGDDVTFNNTGANPAVTLTGTVSPRNMVVNSSTNNYGFTGGVISATGTLTKQGSSTLTFGNTNQFTSVSLEGGAVDVSGVAGTLGTGPLTMAGASIVNVGSGAALTNSSLAVAAGTSNTLSINGGAAAGGTTSIPTLTGDGNLSIVGNVDDKWLALGNTGGFTGELSIGPDGTNATLLGNVRMLGGQTTFPNAVVNLSGLTLANQAGASAAEAVFAFGELNGDAATILNAFIGGSTSRPDAVWRIGDLNTDSQFDGLIVDNAATAADSLSHVLKVGTGKLTLTGLSSYTGDTTVQDGELSVTNAFFADTSDLFVGSTGVLDLDYIGSDSIDSLYFGNVPQAPGVYGGIGSGAQFQVSYITGSGTLSVTTLGGLPGDYNDDGVVDAADYTVWRDGGPLLNETATKGVVDAADYTAWAGNYGATFAPGSALAIPEPAAVASLLVGLTLTLTGRRARRG
jgi:autotransporter-associated beta strand protein